MLPSAPSATSSSSCRSRMSRWAKDLAGDSIAAHDDWLDRLPRASQRCTPAASRSAVLILPAASSSESQDTCAARRMAQSRRSIRSFMERYSGKGCTSPDEPVELTHDVLFEHFVGVDIQGLGELRRFQGDVGNRRAELLHDQSRALSYPTASPCEYADVIAFHLGDKRL